MRLGSNALEFEACGIAMVGNADNGAVIGLTPEAAALCRRMVAGEDVPVEQLAAVDPQLPQVLESGGFTARSADPCRLCSAYLHVTQRCNLDCVGCYSADAARNHVADLPLERLRAILDDLAQSGVEHLVVSGGEPFLRDDLPEILRHAKEAVGITAIDVLTNGTCLTEQKLQAIAPYADRVSVSFDGAAPDAVPAVRRRQLYDQLVDAVRMVQRAGIAAHIIPTLHGRNIDDVEAYVALAERLGCTMNFSLLTVPPDCADGIELRSDDEALRALAAHAVGTISHGPLQLIDTPTGTGLRASVGCGAACSNISVGYDGNAYPCHMLHDQAFCLGAVGVQEAVDLEKPTEGEAPAIGESGHDLPEQAGSVSLDRFDPQQLERIHVDKVEACSDCEFKYLCGGGCRARAWLATGNLYGKDPYCALMQEYYRLTFERLNARLRS